MPGGAVDLVVYVTGELDPAALGALRVLRAAKDLGPAGSGPTGVITSRPSMAHR